MFLLLRSLIVGDLPNPAIQAPIMDAPEVSISDIKLSEPPAYTKGQLLATREAYGSALVRMILVSKFLLLFKNLAFYFDLLTSGLRLIKQA
jgi:hypothetical protein